MKAVAKDCREETAALAATVRAQTPSGPVSVSKTVLDQRKQIVLDHIEQLRADLGPANFQKLDFYVRQSVKLQAPGTSQR